MKTRFDIFLNEARKERFDINFSDDNKRLKIEAGEKMADILRKNLAGRLVNFRTENFIKENFKSETFTHHDAIMNIEDVIYRYESGNQYCSPFLVKSHDRRHTIYYDISPSGTFFYVDDFIKYFKKHCMEKEIIFTEKRDNSTQHLVKNIRGVPKSLKIKEDGLHQADIIEIVVDVIGKNKMELEKTYMLDFKKPITVVGEVDEFDPYSEEVWD